MRFGTHLNLKIDLQVAIPRITLALSITSNTNKMQEITVKEKNVYGIIRLYPVCEKAIIFANLVGSKTLSANDLDLISSLGYKINITKLA